jgi:hypothetical protein
MSVADFDTAYTAAVVVEMDYLAFDIPPDISRYISTLYNTTFLLLSL